MLAEIHLQVIVLPAIVGSIIGYFNSGEPDFPSRLRSAFCGAFVGLMIMRAIIVVFTVFHGRADE